MTLELPLSPGQKAPCPGLLSPLSLPVTCGHLEPGKETEHDCGAWDPGSSVKRWGHLGPSPGTYIAAMVNEACKVAALGGIDDGVMVYPEHVAAADTFVLIPFLPHVSNHLVAKTSLSLGLLHAPATPHPPLTSPLGSTDLADVLAHVFNDHLVGSNRLHGKQAPVVNVALTEFELFLPKLG